jgi:hypothetical protein
MQFLLICLAGEEYLSGESGDAQESATSIRLTHRLPHGECAEMFEEVRPEMRALIFFMVGLSLMGIGILLDQISAVLRMFGP